MPGQNKIPPSLARDEEERLLPAGQVTKPHGIRGEITFQPAVEASDLLQGTVYARKGSGPFREFKVTGLRKHHGNLLLTLDGVNDRNEAEALRGFTLHIPKDRLPDLAEDELYMFQLPGLAVLYRDKTGNDIPLGSITSVDTPAGQELWTITTPDGKEVLFPAVEDFILSIDLERETVLISPPDGLLELYLLP